MRRSLLVVGIAVATVFASGLVAAVPAHALVACQDPDFCPVAHEDPTSPDDPAYMLTFGSGPLSVDATHGVLANDEGGSAVKVDVASSDTESLWGNATIAWQSNLSDLGNGAFTYTPDPATPFTGIDTFDYWIIRPSDGSSDFNTVSITVKPIVGNDTYNVGGTNPTTIPAPGVFANDHGVDESSVSVENQTNAHGTVDLSDDGSFVYTPNRGYNGVASFTYTVFDINGDLSYTRTVTLNADGIAPTAR